MQHFPDGTQKCNRYTLWKVENAKFPEQTKRALEFVERLSEGGYGDKNRNLLF